MPEHVAVGVDLGGTRVRVVAGGKRIETRAPALADLPRFLRRLWVRWGFTRESVAALVVAAKGVWTAAERGAEQRRLRELAGRVAVISDAEAAFQGALGDGAGLLVLSGTGSIVLGRDRRGRWGRAGGLGPLLDDEGSAFWLGRLWLRATVRDAERLRVIARAPDAVTRVAALAPSILRRAARGDRAARAFILNSQELLAALAGQVLDHLRLPRPVRVSWAGSLMDDRAFRAGVWRALRRQGFAVRVVAPVRPPVVAAHAMAERLARGKRP